MCHLIYKRTLSLLLEKRTSSRSQWGKCENSRRNSPHYPTTSSDGHAPKLQLLINGKFLSKNSPSEEVRRWRKWWEVTNLHKPTFSFSGSSNLQSFAHIRRQGPVLSCWSGSRVPRHHFPRESTFSSSDSAFTTDSLKMSSESRSKPPNTHGPGYIFVCSIWLR